MVVYHLESTPSQMFSLRNIGEDYHQEIFLFELALYIAAALKTVMSNAKTRRNLTISQLLVMLTSAH